MTSEHAQCQPSIGYRDDVFEAKRCEPLTFVEWVEMPHRRNQNKKHQGIDVSRMFPIVRYASNIPGIAAYEF